MVEPTVRSGRSTDSLSVSAAPLTLRDTSPAGEEAGREAGGLGGDHLPGGESGQAPQGGGGGERRLHVADEPQRVGTEQHGRHQARGLAARPAHARHEAGTRGGGRGGAWAGRQGGREMKEARMA